MTPLPRQGELHELKVPWAEATATYASLGLPAHWPLTAAEARAVYGPKVEDMVGAAGWQQADVTSSVQRWMGGEPNYGWISMLIVGGPNPD